jgi:hypothetical protein
MFDYERPGRGIAVPQRIAAAISFLIVLCAAPPDADTPVRARGIAWDLFAAERLLGDSSAGEGFMPHADLSPLAARREAPLVTPEPGPSILLGLGLTLLSGGSRRRGRA